ncbi:sugar porter family MFS transporter [Pontiella sulfatireligans]|uniref:Arabinose-proton symporter n=1 Tax=Pontiella sulfatireligans TaxID=2750658 RepID=A0A6C2UCU9_9BACT|nr:sugar porter family MFS transporter [Pontiella sulfatireligans]VGO18008.1 Arabinose-proton symporter [Pontiella sulfatireligans]
MKREHKFNLGYIFGISLVSALGGLLFGYDLVVIGGAKEFYELVYGLSSPALQGWAVSSCIVGCIIGALGVGKPSDTYGRKRLLILSAVLFFLSAVGSGYAPTFQQFVLYRLLGGIGMGMASTLSPMYIAEVSPASMRGRFVSLNQLTIVIGILLAQFVNYLIVSSHPIPSDIETSRPLVVSMQQNLAKLDASLETISSADLLSKDQIKVLEGGSFLQGLDPAVADASAMIAVLKSGSIPRAELPVEALRTFYDNELQASWNGTTGWRVMFWAEAIPAVLFFVFMFMVPFSPRWLVKKGRDDEAAVVLEKIGGQSYSDETLKDIENTLTEGHKEGTWRELFKPHLRKVLTMGVILAVFQQWCGINVIFNYANDIFKAAGYDVSGILFNLLIVGIINMVFTFVAMGLVDRVGRKILLLWGSLGLGACYIGVGFCFHFNVTGVGVLILVLGAIACFSATLGPVMWVLISEIFPNHIRGLAMSIAVLSLWVANFVLSYTFPILNSGLGAATTFWLYAAINILGFFYILKKVPETKGKSLEEIELELMD